MTCERTTEERNALVEQFSGLPYHVARKFRRELDPDFVQELMLGLIRAAETWRPDGGAKFITHGYQQLIWTALRILDDEKRRRPMVALAEEPPAKDRLPDLDLQDAIQELPDREQRIVKLRLDGRTLRQIGTLFGVSYQCISFVEHRAHDKLRVALGD